MKLKALGHSAIQNVFNSSYVDGFTVNTTTQDISNPQNINETKITNTITIEHNKFLHLLFFTADMMFTNLLVNTICVQF
jgi:hypothetical protein